MVIPSLLRHEAILWQVFQVKSFRQYAAVHGLERNVPGLPNRSHGIWLDSLALCLRSQEPLSVRDWALGFGLSSEAQERIQKGKLAERRDLALGCKDRRPPVITDESDEPHSILLWWRSQSSCYRGLFTSLRGGNRPHRIVRNCQ